MSTDELLAEALRLSREERARIAAELLSSLEEMEGEIVAVWAEDLLRRSADVRKDACHRCRGQPHVRKS
jgi:DNA-binding transcriptional regulator YbjK